MDSAQEKRFLAFGLAVAGVGLSGAALAYLLGGEGGRLGAFLGVAMATMTSALALTLKRWALARSIQAALVVIGAMFGARAVVLFVGLWVVMKKGQSPLPFVAGFFGVFAVLQVLEIRYLLLEQQRGRHG